MADGKADQRESTTLRRINPADGNDNDKEVADRLGISARTVHAAIRAWLPSQELAQRNKTASTVCLPMDTGALWIQTMTGTSDCFLTPRQTSLNR